MIKEKKGWNVIENWVGPTHEKYSCDDCNRAVKQITYWWPIPDIKKSSITVNKMQVLRGFSDSQ